MNVALHAPQGRTTMRKFIICSLNRELRMEHGVYGASGKAFTHSVLEEHSFYPIGQYILAFNAKCVSPSLSTVHNQSYLKYGLLSVSCMWIL